ncbi:MAG: formate dehydrogenase accessory sulfurtransferase FdhD [Myxococcales bacterium]|nr:formate dehydrogenase accessory sulfurtransferase FdhD [Myxococcales bacterium]
MSIRDPQISVRRVRHWRHDREGRRDREDVVAVEEPMEIRLVVEGQSGWTSVLVTMRTPGDDAELAVGFLYAEGILRDPADLLAVLPCPSHKGDEANIVKVVLREGLEDRFDPRARNFYASSACGVCGKASLEQLRDEGREAVSSPIEISPEGIAALPERFRKAQAAFDATGGLHAAGLFTAAGELLLLREDVGRHNAVDKIVGERFMDRALPLTGNILMVSGRVSYEIVQKAVAAGIPILCAVGAPSSLAIDLAREFGVTLVGFLRGPRFNVYAHEGRIALR